jgi:hypothetical protein
VEELSYFADTLQQIVDLRAFIMAKNTDQVAKIEPKFQRGRVMIESTPQVVPVRLPLLEGLANDMHLPASIRDLFDEAFDDENNLNANKFPGNPIQFKSYVV